MMSEESTEPQEEESQVDSEEYTPRPKGKPMMFSAGINMPTEHNLSLQTETEEINGFKQQREHEEKVQHLLDKATNMIIWDIRQHPPKRR